MVLRIYSSNPVFSFELLTCLSNHLLVIFDVAPPGLRQSHLSAGLYSALTGVTPFTLTLYDLFHGTVILNYQTVLWYQSSAQNYLMAFLLREKANLYCSLKHMS